MKQKLKRFMINVVAVSAAVAVLFIPATASAAKRDLTDDEKARINAAIQVLKDMEEADWAKDVEDWLKDKKIKADADKSENATTNKDGTITIRADILKKLTKAQADSPIESWKKNADLARMLVHEKVHAHYQAPKSPAFKKNGRKPTDWDDSWTAYKKCTGPEATEVEAYYKFIHMLLDWYQDLFDTEVPEGLSDEEKKAREDELKEKREYVKELIQKWVNLLKKHNYEKGDYLADDFKEIDEGDGTEQAKMKKKLDELKKRIDDLFKENNPYDKARKAVNEAKKKEAKKKAKELVPRIQIFEGVSGLVAGLGEEYIGSEDESLWSLYESYMPAPEGYEYVNILDAGTPVFSIQYDEVINENIYYFLEILVDFSTADDPSDIKLYKISDEKPSAWEVVQEQWIIGEQEAIGAVAPGDGIYAICMPEPTFSDVAPDNPVYDKVEWLYANGLVQGMGQGRFGSGRLLKRAEYAALLVRALGLEITFEHPFLDVAVGKWYVGEVATAFANGLINGMNSTTFAPESSIKNEQAYTILVRAAGLEDEACSLEEDEIDEYLSEIDDAEEISNWARKYVAQAIRAGLWLKKEDVHGNIMFNPEGAVGRETSAEMFYRLLKRE